MIQRIQSVWLLLAAICGFATLKTSFYIGSIASEPANPVNAMSSVWLMILTIVAATVASLSIFMFKNRGLQLKLVIGAIALNLINLILYFLEIKNTQLAVWH